MEISRYIQEAISSGRRPRYGNIEEMFSTDMTFDEFCQTLERCGVNWIPEKYGTLPNKQLVSHVISNWNYQYDTFVLGIGITSLVMVTQKNCFIIDWLTKTKNSEGPAAGMWYKKNGGSMEKMTGELEETIEELNRQMTTDLF